VSDARETHKKRVHHQLNVIVHIESAAALCRRRLPAPLLSRLLPHLPRGPGGLHSRPVHAARVHAPPRGGKESAGRRERPLAARHVEHAGPPARLHARPPAAANRQLHERQNPPERRNAALDAVKKGRAL